MTLSIIVAITENFGIGKDNDLLLNIPGDLKHFKNTTNGHTVVMGSRTFESLPHGALPNRRNIVLSLNPDFTAEGCEIARSIEEVKTLCANDGEIFIMGGGAIYKEFYPLVNRLYLTVAHTEVEADTFFPPIDYTEWTETSRDDIMTHEKCDFPFSFINYTRK